MLNPNLLVPEDSDIIRRLSLETHCAYIKADSNDALSMLGLSMRRRYFGTMPHNRATFGGSVVRLP
jgi:hypothetical protein